MDGTRIASDVRAWARRAWKAGTIDQGQAIALYGFADRIDMVTVEAPVDMRGVPIHMCDAVTVCGDACDVEHAAFLALVSELSMSRDGWSAYVSLYADRDAYANDSPDWVCVPVGCLRHADIDAGRIASDLLELAREGRCTPEGMDAARDALDAAARAMECKRAVQDRLDSKSRTCAIADEMRAWAHHEFDGNATTDKAALTELLALADRIEYETIDAVLDEKGRAIRIGDAIRLHDDSGERLGIVSVIVWHDNGRQCIVVPTRDATDKHDCVMASGVTIMYDDLARVARNLHSLATMDDPSPHDIDLIAGRLGAISQAIREDAKGD